jgi:hypothetical protein
MNNTKKIVILLVLFAGFTAYSFGETFYGFSTGLYRLSEQYHEKKYGRELDGTSLMITFNYYPGKSSLGFYVQTFIGAISTGYELKDDNMDSVNIDSTRDIRLSLGPSFKLQMGTKIRFPISVGPILTFYKEENFNDSSGKLEFFEALTLGALGDVSIIVNPSNRFFLKSGILFSWEFIRMERGMNTPREFYNVQFEEVKYSAYTAAIYMGIGVRFD